jgi:hypothetical protein
MKAPGGERRYSSDSFSTSGLEGGEWSASRPSRALPPVPIGQEAGWAPEPVWTQRLEENSSVSVGDRTQIVQSVVRHYTDCATPAPTYAVLQQLTHAYSPKTNSTDYFNYLPVHALVSVQEFRRNSKCNYKTIISYQRDRTDLCSSNTVTEQLADALTSPSGTRWHKKAGK